MTVGAYGIFDSETNECLYVGLSADIKDRWRNHIKQLKNGRHLRKDFVDWFEEHNRNVDSMIFKVLEECENEDKFLNLLEIKWFNILTPKFAGKIPSEDEKWKHSEETRRKISLSMIERGVRLGIYEDRLCSCGYSFTIRVKINKKYCSRECGYMFGRSGSGRPKTVVERTCIQCGKLPAAPDGKYCSLKCFSLSKVIELNKDRLFDLYWNQELSLKAIAELENVSRQTIYNKMKQFGIARREKEIASGMER